MSAPGGAQNLRIRGACYGGRTAVRRYGSYGINSRIVRGVAGSAPALYMLRHSRGAATPAVVVGESLAASGGARGYRARSVCCACRDGGTTLVGF